MSTPSAINNTARRVNDTGNTLTSNSKRLGQDVNSAEQWWQGEASKAFKSEFDQINAEINKLTRQIQSLEGQLRSLANSVSRADEERRQEALRKKLEAEKLKQKTV